MYYIDPSNSLVYDSNIDVPFPHASDEKETVQRFPMPSLGLQGFAAGRFGEAKRLQQDHLAAERDEGIWFDAGCTSVVRTEVSRDHRKDTIHIICIYHQ